VDAALEHDVNTATRTWLFRRITLLALDAFNAFNEAEFLTGNIRNGLARGIVLEV
jgi:hypothetical protein